MNKNKFMEYVEQNNINLKRYDIVIGEKSNTPYTLGCYAEGSTWFLYDIDERQNCYILRSGTEEEVFKHLCSKMRVRIRNFSK